MRYITDAFIAADHIDDAIKERAIFELRGNIITTRMRFMPKLIYQEISLKNMKEEDQGYLIDMIFPHL